MGFGVCGKVKKSFQSDTLLLGKSFLTKHKQIQAVSEFWVHVFVYQKTCVSTFQHIDLFFYDPGVKLHKWILLK